MLVSLAASAQPTQVACDRDEQMFREWVKTLGSDEFGGRKPMTKYEDMTISYLAAQMEAMGLEPAFDGSWYQPFEMIAVKTKLRAARSL